MDAKLLQFNAPRTILLSVRFPWLDSSHKRNIGLFCWSEFYLVLKPGSCEEALAEGAPAALMREHTGSSAQQWIRCHKESLKRLSS